MWAIKSPIIWLDSFSTSVSNTVYREWFNVISIAWNRLIIQYCLQQTDHTVMLGIEGSYSIAWNRLIIQYWIQQTAHSVIYYDFPLKSLLHVSICTGYRKGGM